MGRESQKAGLGRFLSLFPGKPSLPWLAAVVGFGFVLSSVMSGPSAADGRLISPAEDALSYLRAGDSDSAHVARERAIAEPYGDLVTPGLLQKARQEASAAAKDSALEGDQAAAVRALGTTPIPLDSPSSTSGIPEQGDQTFFILDAGITYVAHAYTSVGSSSFTPPEGVTEVEYLVVAGGGGGGPGGQATAAAGGGGGAGGVLTGTQEVTAIPYTVTVGDGGAGGLPGSAGSNGSPSSFGGIEAVGGGGGGIGPITATSGGSGGGAGGRATTGGETGGSGTPGQGNDGGDRTLNNNAAAGGGGFGSAGQDSGNDSGDGGEGQEFSEFGVHEPIAGGGGGGGNDERAGGEGRAGGGDGSTENGGQGQDAQANTGGGGGGSAGPGGTVGGDGGSGVVIVRYEYELLLDSIPHGGYSAATDSCLQCHDVHEAAGDYVLMREGTVTATCGTCHTLYQKAPTGAYEPGYSGSSGDVSTLEVYRVSISEILTHDGHRLGLGSGTLPEPFADGQFGDGSYIPGGGDTLGAIEYLSYPDVTSVLDYSATDGLYCASCHTPHGGFGETMEIGVTLLKARPNHVGDGVEIGSWPGEGGRWCGACHDRRLPGTEEPHASYSLGSCMTEGCHYREVIDFPHTNASVPTSSP